MGIGNVAVTSTTAIATTAREGARESMGKGQT